MNNKKNNKIDYDTMKNLFDQQLKTFVNKNHDYGNSFEQSLEKHGLIAGVVRMEDKMNRISFLVSACTDPKVLSESLPDTLMDLANYATMAAAWLKNHESTFEYEMPEKDIFVKALLESVSDIKTEWLTINNAGRRVLIIYPLYETEVHRDTHQPFVCFRDKPGQWYILLIKKEGVRKSIGYYSIDHNSPYVSAITYDKHELARIIRKKLDGDMTEDMLMRLDFSDVEKLMNRQTTKNDLEEDI